MPGGLDNTKKSREDRIPVVRKAFYIYDKILIGSAGGLHITCSFYIKITVLKNIEIALICMTKETKIAYPISMESIRGVLSEHSRQDTNSSNRSNCLKAHWDSVPE